MIHLRVLGVPLASRGGAGPEESAPLTRGFRLAMLAIVAASGERGITRDKLQAILWADSDAARAAASLSQTLYGLRQDLGSAEAIRAAGPALIVDTTLVHSDLRAFEDAFAAEDWQGAATMYGGPFLEGFYLKDAAEFERWIERTRSRLSDMYATALDRGADDAAKRQDQDQMVELLKQRAMHDLLDSRVARRYMEALAAAGDRAGAVRHAMVHEEAVRAELGAAADPSVRQLAKQLRREMESSGPIVLPSVAAPPSTRPQTVPTPAPVPSQDPAPAPAPAPTPPPVAATTLSDRAATAGASTLRPRVLLAAGAVALAGLFTWAGSRTSDSGQSAPPGVGLAGPQRLAVLPFSVSDSSLRFLRQGMVDLLGHQLQGAGGLRAIPASITLQGTAEDAAGSDEAALAEAKRLGVPFVLRGTIVGSASHFVLSARLIDSHTPSQPLLASAEGPLDSLGVIVDRVAAALLVARSGEQPNRVNDLSKRALAPLQAYLAGQAAYRNGRLADAVRYFREALERDPDFALAALGLARSGGFNPGGSTWRADEAGIRASEQAARLSARDRVLFEAFVGSAPTEPTTAARRLADWRKAAEMFPDDHEALFWYGDQYFHTGSYLGLPRARDRARALFEQALQRDSLFAFPVAHLLELAAAEGDRARVEKLYAHYARLDTTEAPESFGYISWRTAVSLGDVKELEALRATYDTMPTQSLERIVTFSQLDGGIRLEDAELAARAMLARNELMVRRVTTLFVAHTLYLNRGRSDDAKRTLAMLRAQEPLTPGQIEHVVNTRVLAITDALYGDGDVGEAAAAATALQTAVNEAGDRTLPAEGRARAAHFAERCALELWKLHRDDRRTVKQTIRQLRDAAGRPDVSSSYAGNPGLCAQILETQLAADEGRADRATQLQRLDALMADGPQSFGGHIGNIVVARLAERAGRPDMALRAVQRRRYFPADGAVYLSTLLRLEARLAASVGDQAVAAKAQAALNALRAPSPASVPRGAR